MEFFIEDLIKSGVTYIPPYVEPQKVENLSINTTNINIPTVPKINSPSDTSVDLLKCDDKKTLKNVEGLIHKSDESINPSNSNNKESLPQVIRRKSRISISGGTSNNNTSSFDERKT